SQKNKTNTPDKMVLRKYCRFCKKTTEHKESTKFK
ncbi:MAG: 50S ribosomal protein L33, partial [Patescibacteria group bacterium]